MADQTSTPLPPIPPSKSGEAIYDGIMQEIEPELTTAMLPTLEAKYKDETPEQKRSRAKRYAKAFEEYERRYAAYKLEQEAQVRSFKIQAIRFAEGKAQDDERGKLNTLESSLGSK